MGAFGHQGCGDGKSGSSSRGGLRGRGLSITVTTTTRRVVGGTTTCITGRRRRRRRRKLRPRTVRGEDEGEGEGRILQHLGGGGGCLGNRSEDRHLFSDSRTSKNDPHQKPLRRILSAPPLGRLYCPGVCSLVSRLFGGLWHVRSAGTVRRGARSWVCGRLILYM